jgi:nitroreductase
MDAIEALLGRRSVRKYQDRPVEPEKVDVLLRAAMAAPSAGNEQPWRFVVVTDRGQLDRLSTATEYSGMLAAAPLAVVVCGDTAARRYPEDYWIQDCSAAMENLLVAAHATGLGACWLGYHPRSDRTENARAILGLPSEVEVLGVASVGYPTEAKPPSERFDPAFVHHDRW